MKKFICALLAVIMAASLLVLPGCTGSSVAIGVQKGTTGEFFLTGNADFGYDGFSNIEVKKYANGGMAVKDLQNGNISYVVIDGDVAKELVAKNDGLKVIEYPLTVESYGVAVDPNNAELLEQINAILASKSAEIQKIFDNYTGVESEDDYNGEAIPAGEVDNSNPDKQLVVATNAEFAPFEFKNGDKFAGIDMEIAKLIADELGMELVIVHMDFDAVTTAVGKNNVDIALAGLTINPARAKVVNFSTPYYTEAYQVVICKDNDKTFDDCKSSDDVLEILKGLNK